LADNRRLDLDVGETTIRIDRKTVTTLVVFGDERAGSILGAYTLEGLGLAVDPLKRRLMPTDAFLMREQRG
jgi:predicted aspartyl protease